MPHVLEALRFGNRGLYAVYPDLNKAAIWVQRHAKKPHPDRIEEWSSLAKNSYPALQTASQDVGSESLPDHRRRCA